MAVVRTSKDELHLLKEIMKRFDFPKYFLSFHDLLSRAYSCVAFHNIRDRIWI